MRSRGSAVISVRRPRATDPAAIKRTGASPTSLVIVLGFPAREHLKTASTPTTNALRMPAEPSRGLAGSSNDLVFAGSARYL
jgi:hypothetical protein